MIPGLQFALLQTPPLLNMVPSAQPCPDPAAHEHKNHKLQDSAAGAALYATKKSQGLNYPLDADKKLSSAGAATSLKYARAQDLPSFPSVGIDTKNSGLTAATLAHQNKTQIEWWTPVASADASKAAMLAKDYKMQPQWQHEASAAGSKAAKLAHQAPAREWWQPQASRDGHSAATLAMRNKGLSPQLDYGHTDQGRNNSLMAARQASIKGRNRSESVPALANSYPDAHNASSNALGAATSANNASRLGPNSMSREMYTERPPVDIEVEERRHQDALQASAISMAKSMYAMQRVDDDGNITINQSLTAANTAHNTGSTNGDRDIKKEAMQYLNLQDAAQKLAAERLAKIGNQHENAAFRDYWGQPSQPKRRSRLSLKSGPRRRATSMDTAGRNLDIDSDEDDTRTARRVRAQMSQFNSQLADVDAKKRARDQQNLLAAAEKKVQAQMNKLDEKVYNETGKMSPAMEEEWANKARARAVAASEVRMQNHGKVHIGGSKYLDQSEIDAIAAARVQPFLDEINSTAEKQRARDEEIRMDQAEAKRAAQIEKQEKAEAKAEKKRKEHEEKLAEKVKKQEQKQAAKTERHVDKEKASESSRLVKQENRISADHPENSIPTETEPISNTVDRELSKGKAVAIVPEPSHNIVEGESSASASAPKPAHHAATLSKPAPNAGDIAPRRPVKDEEMPTSPTRKRFSNFLGKLKRKKDKSTDEPKEKGFQGGSSLTGATVKSPPVGASTHTSNRTSSPAEIRSPSVSELSSDDDMEPVRGRTKSRLSDGGSEEFVEAQDHFDEALVPPPKFESLGKSNSPVRDSKFHEAL